MTRPARAVVDLHALRSNYLHARAVHGGRVAAVMKANAYGHGAVRCALAIADIVDAIAVAFTEEAVHLRLCGVKAPILVLEGAFEEGDLVTASNYGLWMVVHHIEQVKMLERCSRIHTPIATWLKVDTGMHRAGVDPASVKAVWLRLKACACVSSITLMTHLSSADEPARPTTHRQLKLFRASTSGLECERSAANSAGLLTWEGARHEWARTGLMIYGVHPLSHEAPGLLPVMSLSSQVFAERWIARGESVGYGESFVAGRRTRVGLVAIGYADGYPRNAPTGTAVAINGRIARTIGRVSMDMLTVDLTDLPEAGVGCEVELWGAQLPVHSVAAAAGTIPYELLCNVKRVPFSYSEPDLPSDARADNDASAASAALLPKVKQPNPVFIDS